MTEERVARAGLSRLLEPGDLRTAGLLPQLGAVGLYEALLEQDRDGELFGDAAGRTADVDPDRELALAARQGIRFVIPGDDEWPAALDDLGHGATVQEMGGVPVGLWVRGPLRLDKLTGAAAVVGSRSSTTYGDAVAAEIGAGLARAGRAVVSGGALGIDQAAHRGALAMRGPTVAVLACGADRHYPAVHRDLLDHIATVGAVVSELPLGCAPMRHRFLARNRLIAALAGGTVVVEAAVRSGALNTAHWASGLSRPLMAVPGPVTSAPSQGVHELVRTGAATLVTGPADVLEVVGGAGEHLMEAPREAERPRDRLSRRHRQVLEATPVGSSAPLRSIAAAAGVGVQEAQTALTYLAERDFVVRTGHGWRLGDAGRADLPRARR